MLNTVKPEKLNIWPDFLTVRSLNTKFSEITDGEFRDLIENMKNYRSPGEDLIAGESLKPLGEAELRRQMSVLNGVLWNEFVPTIG